MIFAQLRTLLLPLASHLVLTTTTLAHTDHPSNWTPQQTNPVDTLWASTNAAVPIVTREQHTPLPNLVPVQLSRKPQQLVTHTQTIGLPTPQQPQGVLPFINPLSIIVILCAVQGFISTFTTSPFSFQMSSSPKPSGSSTSSSSPKPSSSSSSPTPKPSSPQPIPTISANAWMSFFLFCCLILIILQGPLGLTGGGALPGVAQWAQWPNFGGGGGGGGGWWGGWNGLSSGLGLGGAPGCVGVMAGVVPWCQPQVHQLPPQPHLVPPLPQVQIQQIVQNAPLPPHYPPPRQRIVSHQAAAGVGAQMGGQGGFATPEGGGGWSWYANGPSPASPGVVRQYTGGKFIFSFLLWYTDQHNVHKSTIHRSSDQSNINVQVFNYKSQPVPNNQLTLTHKFPTNLTPTLTPNILHTDVQSTNHGFALLLLLMPNHTLPAALERCMNLLLVLMPIGTNNRILTFSGTDITLTAITKPDNSTWLIPNATFMQTHQHTDINTNKQVWMGTSKPRFKGKGNPYALYILLPSRRYLVLLKLYYLQHRL
ncbi:hypothetical protein CNBA7200 [Cryptococcus deneoformans B-3501A]|uniref:hypothetical protein n=1 Tax=Cryptococcus deneoformans (strain B-3501A) TaxID=283643 RepID=UPI000042EFFE|nr:hypothetical protein CNBA7200 [Cryptococcus neoformans var. neoformans B-3501A]EAL22952.1 hypothetical protein CNBA7200 [Cryptococcus neoformans var. neoformans B-3501A]